MKVRNPKTGKLEEVYLQPGGDTLPIGTIVEIPDDVEIPYGYELYEKSVLENQVAQTIKNDVTTNMNNSITATQNGVALIVIGAEFAINSTGYRRVIVSKNGGGISILNNTAQAVSGNVTTIQCMALVNCVSGDVFCSRVLQNSGSSLDCTSKIQLYYL